MASKSKYERSPEPVHRTNTSGETGVRKRGNRWVAAIKVNNRMMHLGSFLTKEEAVTARQEAEKRYRSNER